MRWCARAGVGDAIARGHQRQRQPPRQHAISDDLEQMRGVVGVTFIIHQDMQKWKKPIVSYYT